MELSRNTYMPQMGETLSERTWRWLRLLDDALWNLILTRKKLPIVGSAAWNAFVRETLAISPSQNTESRNSKTFKLVNHSVAFPMLQLASRFSYYQNEAVIKLDWLVEMHRMTGRLKQTSGFVSDIPS